MDDSGFKVRVVEKGGRQLKSILQRSDVEPKQCCLDGECPVCITSPKGLFQMESVGYRIWCKDCEEVGVSRFPGDPLSRPIEDVIRIDHQRGISLNDKAEFVRPAGMKMTASRM